ncbi:hypothetical protein [Mycobacterium sp. SMC-19]|uniref:hypothetical protein n=1 Tax=Mycobacterium sp. SMC-19 TaxID=3381630 RepID=UPI003876828E
MTGRTPRSGERWLRVIGFRVLPVAVLALAAAAALLKWYCATAPDPGPARAEAVRAATESTIAILSYQPDSVQKDLEAARDRLTGAFRDSYTALIHDVVIPGSHEKKISAVATIPAAASISASATGATVLLFVNQSIVIGQGAPTWTASSVVVSLEKVGGRWLISKFETV